MNIDSDIEFAKALAADVIVELEHLHRYHYLGTTRFVDQGPNYRIIERMLYDLGCQALVDIYVSDIKLYIPKGTVFQFFWHKKKFDLRIRFTSTKETMT